MPAYDYRCKRCGTRFELVYKTYADYDAAAATRACPTCASPDLDRLIRRVAVQAAGSDRDYAGMSSGDMLNVLEGGDAREIDALYRQTGADAALADPDLRAGVNNAVTEDS